MKKKHFTILCCILGLLFPCCKKFDHSKIKMPEIKMITAENLHSVVYLDTDHIWIFGNHGTILFSADGGKTWNKQESGVDELLDDGTFINKQKGWAVGVKGTIVHSSDGGKTWVLQKSGTENNLFEVFFLDEKNGWAVGEYGTIIHTSDGGESWNSLIEEKDTIYNGVFFTDPLTGWVVGEFGHILHTEDGGKTWVMQECKDIIPVISETEWSRPLPSLFGVFFLDRYKGWIVGMDGVILMTIDGGENWKKLPSGTDKPLYTILIKGSKGWVVGNKGSYVVSEDGGLTWATKPKAIKTKFWLRDVSFCNQKDGFIVGAMGTVVVSHDGGETWEIISGFTYEMEEYGLADF